MEPIKKSFNINPDISDKLDKIIEQNPDISYTFIINQALRNWLNNPSMSFSGMNVQQNQPIIIQKNNIETNQNIITQENSQGIIKNEIVKQPIKTNTPSNLIAEEKPAIKAILRVWKAKLPPNIPWQQRRSHLEELFQMIRSNGYKEEDLPSKFREDVLANWLPKNSTTKGSEHMIAKSIEDYELAIAILCPKIEITSSKIQSKSNTKISGEIDIDIAYNMTVDDDELAAIMENYNKIREGVDNE